MYIDFYAYFLCFSVFGKEYSMDSSIYTKKHSLYHFNPVFRITDLCTVGEAVRSPGYAFAGEMHDFAECLFVLDGKCDAIAGEKVYKLEKGQMIFHPPMEFHRLINDSSFPVHILIISFTASPCPLNEHRIFTFHDSERIRTLVERLRSVMVTKGLLVCDLADGSNVYELQSAISRIENYLISLFEHGGEIYVSSDDKPSELYSKAVRIMENNLNNRLSAEELASLCGMSVSSIQKLFLKYAGMGMIKYYNNLRMQRARQLLEDGKSVKETALSLSYEDQNYFSIAYKRHFGISPSKQFKIRS